MSKIIIVVISNHQTKLIYPHCTQSCFRPADHKQQRLKPFLGDNSIGAVVYHDLDNFRRGCKQLAVPLLCTVRFSNWLPGIYHFSQSQFQIHSLIACKSLWRHGCHPKSCDHILGTTFGRKIVKEFHLLLISRHHFYIALKKKTNLLIM